MTSVKDYPFAPKTNAGLKAGQFWSIPLSDGRFACGRVLRPDQEVKSYGRRVLFIGGLEDWVGAEPPTSETIAGRPILGTWGAHVRIIAEPGGQILGERPLELDGIEQPPARVNLHMGRLGALAEAERRFVKPAPARVGERREVRSPLSDAALAPARDGQGIVQFGRPLTDEDYARLADWLRQYPDMTLRAYLGTRDLEFLRFFGFHRHFALDGWKLESADGLRYLPDDLETLGLGLTKRKIDLSVLARFRGLKALFIEGQPRHIEVLSELTELEDLTLRSVTLPDLSILVPLRKLRSLDLKLGGTNDLRLLPRVGRLRYLELWHIRGLTDVSAVGDLPDLRQLFLQALPGVTALPDLSRDVALKEVTLHTMKGLRDLRALATAPALEQLAFIQMRNLQPDDFRPLVGLPRLRAAVIDVGSLREHHAVKEILDLPEPLEPFDWRKD